MSPKNKLEAFEPDNLKSARESRKARVHAECNRRISARYSLERQVQILLAHNAGDAKHVAHDSVREIIVTDAIEFISLMGWIALNRLAANALCDLIDRPTVVPSDVNPSLDSWWPTIKEFEGGKWRVTTEK